MQLRWCLFPGTAVSLVRRQESASADKERDWLGRDRLKVNVHSLRDVCFCFRLMLCKSSFVRLLDKRQQGKLLYFHTYELVHCMNTVRNTVKSQIIMYVHIFPLCFMHNLFLGCLNREQYFKVRWIIPSFDLRSHPSLQRETCSRLFLSPLAATHAWRSLALAEVQPVQSFSVLLGEGDW